MREFIIELDRPRRLVYDFDALDRITDRFKLKEQESVDLTELLKIKFTPPNVIFLIYAGLAWQDQEITEAKTKDLLNIAMREGKTTFIEATSIMGEALFVQFGISLKPKESIEGEGEATADKTKKAPAPKPVIPGSRKSGK